LGFSAAVGAGDLATGSGAGAGAGTTGAATSTAAAGAGAAALDDLRGAFSALGAFSTFSALSALSGFSAFSFLTETLGGIKILYGLAGWGTPTEAGNAVDV
jgi:hypothetical protein